MYYLSFVTLGKLKKGIKKMNKKQLEKEIKELRLKILDIFNPNMMIDLQNLKTKEKQLKNTK